MRSIFRIACSAAVAWLLALAPANAQQVKVQVGEGLICDTQKQTERFVALYDGDAETALAAVNHEEKDPTACAVATIAFVLGPDVGTVRNRDGSYQIVRILVLGVLTEQGLQATVPAPFYSIVKLDEQDA
jgi:hypothetical protein